VGKSAGDAVFMLADARAPASFGCFGCAYALESFSPPYSVGGVVVLPEQPLFFNDHP
jgi:hypothetical protein